MQWQSPRNNDAFDITSLHHAASHNFACVVHFFCGAHGAWTASALQEWT